MRAKRSVLFTVFVFAALAQVRAQQSASWRNYGLAEGFPESAFRSVTIADSGAILAVGSTSSNVCIFDGYETKSIILPEEAARVYQSPASQLWTVSSHGLWFTRESQWNLFSLAELAQVPHAGRISLCPIRINDELCLLPDRLVECSAEDPTNLHLNTLRAAADLNIGRFSSMAIGVEDELWILGERGVARLSGPRHNFSTNGDWRQYLLPESLHLQHLQHAHPDGTGLTLVADSALDGESRIVTFDGERWQARDVGMTNLAFTWHGPENSLWASSPRQLFRVEEAGLTAETELSPRQYYDVGVDWRGTFWLATSAGLVRYKPALWQPARPGEKVAETVRSLAMDGRWPETFGQISCFDGDPARTEGVASSRGGNYRPIGVLRDGRICYAADPVHESNPRNRLATFDGTNFQTLPMFVPQPAADSALLCFLATQSGDLWLAGDFGAASLHGRWTVFPAADRATPPGICHFLELPSGRIWGASRDRIWSFDGKDWSLMRGGFNHLTAMICARDGSVWVGAGHGVSRFTKGHWIENNSEDGLREGAVLALCEDQHGGIWAAGSNGVSLYHPEADTDAPRTFIAPMTDKQKNIPEDGVIKVAFGGRDKWDETTAHRLFYSYRLDTSEWSPFGASDSVAFSDLPPGKHYFQVRAMDRAGNIDSDPARLDFAIVLPWYEESRLVLIATAGVVTAGFFAVLAWRRHRALVLSYAQVEKQVAERTRELELANQELLHSQKMTALGTLSAGIAHDFNNILSIVKGSTQIIEDNIDNPEKIRTRADRIKTVVEQGTAVVQAMLGFSRGSDEVLEACEINPVLDNTIKLLGDRFLRDVELHFDRAPDLPAVRASQSLIQQILLNFIFNAAESMNGRKRVIISTARADSLPSSMALQPGQAPGYVSVAVRDFGCGIAPELAARVFEPFFTTKALSTRRGTGLGLSIVYELARKMNAGLALESTVGEGSVFSLYLPAAPKVEPATKVES